MLITVDAGAVPIPPPWQDGVAADNFESDEIKTPVGIGHVRTDHISQHIGLAAARGTRTGSPQKLQIEKRFLTVIPFAGELVADLLNVLRLQTHNVDLNTMSILRAIFDWVVA